MTACAVPQAAYPLRCPRTPALRQRLLACLWGGPRGCGCAHYTVCTCVCVCACALFLEQGTSAPRFWSSRVAERWANAASFINAAASLYDSGPGGRRARVVYGMDLGTVLGMWVEYTRETFQAMR